MEEDFNATMPLKDILVNYERLFRQRASSSRRCEADSDYHKELSLFEEGTIIDFPDSKVLIVGFDNEDSNENLICLTKKKLNYPTTNQLIACRTWFSVNDASAKLEFLINHFGDVHIIFLNRKQFIFQQNLELKDCIKLLEKELL